MSRVCGYPAQLRRWANIKTTLFQCIVFVGIYLILYYLCLGVTQLVIWHPGTIK